MNNRIYTPAEPETEAQEQAPPLPAIKDAFETLRTPMEKPKEIISGILHQGLKGVIGGGSKSFKTWSLMDMAVSVATGTPWWGIDTIKGRVLYVNFEIPEVFFRDRLLELVAAKQVSLTAHNLDHWPLRGRAVDIDVLLPEFISRLSGAGYSLVIFDPTYKLMGNRDENSASDVGSLVNAFEKIAVDTGAAVVWGAHFSKGNQSGKESMDRISGSGVFARDPDTILIMTRHEEENAFTVEPTLRNLPQVEPFVVRWEFPLMRLASDLDPGKLKKVKGRGSVHSVEDVLRVLDSGKMTTSQWAEAAKNEEGISESTFYLLRRKLEKDGKIFKSKLDSKWSLKP